MARLQQLVLGTLLATNVALPSPQQMLHDIHSAIATGAASYTMPAGVFNFSGTGLAFTLTNATNFVLNGAGASETGTLLIFAAGQGISMANCSNVTLNSFALDNSPLGFTQGVVSNLVHTSGGAYVTFDLDLDDGYPTPDTLPGYVKTYWWNATTRLLYHDQVQTSPVMHNYTRIGGSVWRIVAHMPSTLNGWVPPAEGSLATLSASPAPGIQAANCSGLLVQDITLYGAAGMGFVEGGGGGGTEVRRWRAVRPPPSLLPANRLLVSTIDGVHSTSMERGLTLVDSEVSFAGDDLFAVHCELGIAWGPTDSSTDGSSSTSSIWIIDTGGYARTIAATQPGDALSFWALNLTMDPLWEGTVASIAVEPNATLQAEAANAAADIKRQLGLIIRPLSPGSTLLMRVDFTQPLPSSVTPRFSSLAQYDGRCGRGTLVTNTTLHDGTGGMRLKGAGVTVDGVVISRAYGMRMLPEAFWTQSVSKDVTIANSVFHECGDAPAAPDAIAYANDTCPGLVLRNNTLLPQ